MKKMTEEIKNKLIEEIEQILELLNYDMDYSSICLEDVLFLFRIKERLMKNFLFEVEKQTSMKKTFVDKLGEMLIQNHCYLGRLPKIMLENKQNYYILKTAYLIGSPDGKGFGKFTCIFDQTGKLINQLSLNDEIFFANLNSYYILRSLDDSCEFFKRVNERWELCQTFQNVKWIEKINDNLMSIHHYNFVFSLYNQRRNQIMGNNILTISPVSSEFYGDEKLYVIERINETSEGVTVLNILIDQDGVDVGKRLDFDHNSKYFVDFNEQMAKNLKQSEEEVLYAQIDEFAKSLFKK